MASKSETRRTLRELHGDDVEVFEMEAERVGNGRYLSGPTRIPAGLAALAIPLVLAVGVIALLTMGVGLYFLFEGLKGFYSTFTTP